jgi:hypothetical protein
VRYPIGWTILFSSIIFKKCILKNWKSTNSSMITRAQNVESAWAMERNKMVQFEAIWQRVMQALEMGVSAGGS